MRLLPAHLPNLSTMRWACGLCAAVLLFSCYPSFPDGDDDSGELPTDDDDSGGPDDDDSGGSDDDDATDPINPADFWITGVTLYDLDSDPELATDEQAWISLDQNIAVLDGVITEIADELPADVAAEQIREFSGRVVLPGFIDSKVQLAEDGSTTFTGDHVLEHLRAQLAAGVTTVVDNGGPTWLFDLRTRTALPPGSPGHILGPRILASGPYLTSAGQYPCEANLRSDRCHLVGENETSTTAATNNLLDLINNKDPDFRTLVLETTDTLQDHRAGTANEIYCGTTVCGSISTQRRNEILASLDAIPPPAPPVMIHALREIHYIGATGIESLIGSIPLTPKAIMAQVPYLEPIAATNNNYSVVPTYFSHAISGLTAIDALSLAIDLGPLLSPDTTPGSDPTWERLGATVPSVSRQAWIDTIAAIQADADDRAGLDYWYENTVGAGPGQPVRAWQDNAASLIGRLMPYSLPLAAGSGAGSLFVPHGLGLHWELLQLENTWLQYPQSLGSYSVGNEPTHWAPLVRREALRAATSLPADLLGLSDIGRIAVGKRADFIVLDADADPLADLEDTQRVVRIFLGGEEFTPADLALSSGDYSDQVQPLDPPVGNDQTCFVDADCTSSWGCDLVNHRCRLLCSAAADLDACEEQFAGSSYCAAADGLAAEMACSDQFFSTIDSDGDGDIGCDDSDCHASTACPLSATQPSRTFICRNATACNPYFYLNPDISSSNQCPGSGAPYHQNCVPADLDTDTCIDSGRGTPDLADAGQCQTRATVGTRIESWTACEAGLICDWALAANSVSFTSNSCRPLCNPSPSTIQMMCPTCNMTTWPNSSGSDSSWYGVCDMPGFSRLAP
jgi:hypothetical protein